MMNNTVPQVLAADGLARARRIFHAARAVVSDIDGVLLVSGRATAGAQEMLQRRRCAFVSNNSTHTARTLARAFAETGLSAGEEDFFLAGETAVDVIARKFAQARVLALASGDVLALARERLCLVDERALPETVDVVLVCRDETLTFSKLERAANALRCGAAPVLANPDLTHPAALGRVHLETGALWRMLEVFRKPASNPVVIGKPAAALVLEAARHLAMAPHELVFLGDNLQTDARAAQAAGMPFIHVGGDGFDLLDLLGH